MNVTTAGQPAAERTGQLNGRLLNLAELSDHALVERARVHDPGAFEAIMRRYNRRLFRAARSILREDASAQDAVQEAYIRAFIHLDGYEPRGSFGAWLTRIAVNEALMIRRRQRRDTISIEDVDEASLHSVQLAQDEEFDAHAALDSRHARVLLEQAVDALPEVFRTVFVLRAVEQLSINETAACLGLNESTVKTRLHRANRRLRADLAKRFGREQLQLFEFLGERCDRIVQAVLERLLSAPSAGGTGTAVRT